MSPVPVSPRRVFGVDFSAARDAGSHIWICRAHPGNDGIRVDSIDPLSELPGGAVDRATALPALVQKVTESPRSAWGFDFSFGLPKAILGALAPGVSRYDDQLGVVAGFAQADTLRARCIGVSPDIELRRRTDDEASTPFSPYNLRIYKQTFHGLTEVVRPLRTRPEVAVLPFDALPQAGMQAGAQAGEQTGVQTGERLPFNRAASDSVPHIYLLEVCPASVLATLEHPTRGYKGGGEPATEARQGILRRMVDDGLVRPMSRAQRNRVIDDEDGDALDAVLAAVGAWRGTRDYDHAALRADPMYGLEGFVYT